VAEQPENPHRVCRPPVEVVAVEDDGRIAIDTLVRHQTGERRTIDVVAYERVVQVGVPVDLDRAGDVARLVEEDVLVTLDDNQTWIVEMLGEPCRAHKGLRVDVVVELRVGVVRYGAHRSILSAVSLPRRVCAGVGNLHYDGS
jgi:hypothetical protein